MKKTCAYCGKLEATTRDHVPPKGLFIKPYPENMITVPACEKCHNKLSLEDEYFMMALGLVLSTDETEHSIFLTAKVKRALARPEAKKLKASLSKGTRKVGVHSGGGIYLGEALAVDFEWRRLECFAKRVLVGLHNYEHSRLITKGYDASVFLSWSPGNKNILDSPEIKDLLGLLSKSKKTVVGRNTLQYWVSSTEDDPNRSFWYIRIAEEFGFFGFISSKEELTKASAGVGAKMRLPRLG